VECDAGLLQELEEDHARERGGGAAPRVERDLLDLLEGLAQEELHALDRALGADADLRDDAQLGRAEALDRGDERDVEVALAQLEREVGRLRSHQLDAAFAVESVHERARVHEIDHSDADLRHGSSSWLR
jgi:hypothetical protein